VVVMASVARRFMVFSLGAVYEVLRCARNRGRAPADMQVPTAPAIEGKIDFQIGVVPADGT